MKQSFISVFVDAMRTFSLSLRKSPGYASLLVVLTVLLGLYPVIGLFLLQRVMQHVFSPATVNVQSLITWALLWIVCILSENALGEIRVYITTVLQLKINQKLSVAYIDKLSTVPVKQFEVNTFSDRLARVGQVISSDMMWEYMLNLFYIPLLIISAVSLFTYISAISKTGLWLFGVTAVLQMVWLFLSRKESYQHEKKMTENTRKRDYFYSLFFSKIENRDMRVFKTPRFFIDKWQHFFAKSARILKGIRRKYFLLYIVIFCLNCVVLFFAVDISTFATSPETLVPMLIGIAAFMAAITDAVQCITDFFTSGMYLSEYYNFMNTSFDTPHTEKTGVLAPDELVSLSNVSYRYPGQDEHYALQSVSLSIKKGETIAVVGDNGAGKSTLVKLLLGLYAPTSGTIQYAIEPHQWKKQVSSEFQDYIRYEYALEENVGLGDGVLFYDQQAIDKAIEAADINDIISTLPHHKKQRLGSRFEDSIAPSGGQWQRIGLARASLRESILLSLDEPTASLDPNAEAQVFQSFLQRKAPGRAVIIVAHRIGPAKMADRIFVLKDGRLAECACHDELMQLGGVYYQLYQKQAQWYK